MRVCSLRTLRTLTRNEIREATPNRSGVAYFMGPVDSLDRVWRASRVLCPPGRYHYVDSPPCTIRHIFVYRETLVYQCSTDGIAPANSRFAIRSVANAAPAAGTNWRRVHKHARVSVELSLTFKGNWTLGTGVTDVSPRCVECAYWSCTFGLPGLTGGAFLQRDAVSETQ